jgi:fimbrial chaperone protein
VGFVWPLFLASQSAYAFKLTPMHVYFAPSGREATQTFRVENESEHPVAVQLSMAVREMDIDGNETYGEAEDEFIVYPPQLVVMPRQVQAVRVQWVGDPKPPRELTYRIIAEQLPVDLEKGEQRPRQAGAVVNLLVRYMGAVYVVPQGAKPDVVIDSVTEQRGEGGAGKLLITLHNRGTAHAIMGNLKLRLSSSGGVSAARSSVDLGPGELQGMEGENILAGHKRRFVIPRPLGLAEGPVEVTFDFAPWR